MSDNEGSVRSRSGSRSASGSRSGSGSRSRSRSGSRSASGSRAGSRSGSGSRAGSRSRSGSRRSGSGSRSRSGSRRSGSGSRSRSGSRRSGSGSRSRSGSRRSGSGSRSRSRSGSRRSGSGSRSRSRSGSRRSGSGSRSRSRSGSRRSGSGSRSRSRSGSRSGSASRSGGSQAGSDDENVSGRKRKKKQSEKVKKKKKARQMFDSEAEDDEEEEDEEGADLDGNLEGFIDDNAVEDEEDGEGSGNEGKRKHESDLEEDLEDDDYDLIKENVGIDIKKKKRRRRIRSMSGDEESEPEDKPDDREEIARQIFEGDDDEPREDEEEEPSLLPLTKDERGQEYDELSGSEEEDVDDFIVDDDGQPISKTKKKKTVIHDDQALQEAQEIFGVDFDFDDLEQDYDDYDEEEDDEYDEEFDGDEERPRPQKKVKKRGKKGTIYEVFEPSDLARAHYTDHDQEVRNADMPERFQLRSIPVSPTEEGELDDEAEWIYKYAFVTAPVSKQDYWEQSDNPIGSGSRSSKKGLSAVPKIKVALKFMRNQQFEVPFIAFYRKEYVEPELNINDLWKVYAWDEKWMQLRNRKQALVKLFENMQSYQFDQIDPEKPLDSSIRALTEEDLRSVRGIQSMEELKDVYQHFLLYYGTELPKMKAHFKAKKKAEKALKAPKIGEEEGAEEPEPEDEEEQEQLKQATRKTGYTMCVQAGLAEMARKFGLTPEQFGENLRDNYQRHDVEQDPAEPNTLAEEFIKRQFSTSEDVLKGARHMVAMQIAHNPVVRQCVREVFYDRCTLSCEPTKQGLKAIDESHPLYTFKYLKDKPIKNLLNDQFLRIVQAEEDGMLTYELNLDQKNHGEMYFQEIESLYHKDEFSSLAQEWNRQRSMALERALTQILYPQMIKEMKGKLLDEARESIIKASCRKLYSWLKVAPYQADTALDDEDALDALNGLRVMGIACAQYRDEASYTALIDGDGEVTDFMKLPGIIFSKRTWKDTEREAKMADLEKVKEFIAAKKPHVIAVAASNRDVVMVMEDLKQVVKELEEEQQMAPINVELIDNELATVYANSKKAEADLREYPLLLRQAVSIARRLQDPLIEFSQLCNADEDILCLKYHQLQDTVTKEEMLNALYLEFVNRVNEVGVDINQCVNHPHTAPLVQFVCGLGPRKGYHLIKILKQNNSRLENRTQLVTVCHMGPKVFINCGGFIKIDTTALGDSTEAYVEVLDGSRVHPETYEWARKMAVDALEYDDSAEDANPAGALEEILENPERLKDLDLDAFADELERQGFGDRHITLYDIRAELNHRYKDLRVPYRSPTLEERFNMLTKETPQTFYIGKLVMCAVTGFATKKPHGEQLDQANPVRSEETGLWQCPFCQKNDFPELSEVWNHFDAGQCPGQSVGVRTRLDNGVGGFISVKNISDKHVATPEERVKVGMTLHCRIIKIDIDRFQVELTCKTSDLVDKDSKWKPQKDPFYDIDKEDSLKKKEEDKAQKQARQTYVKRVIAHPSFHNIDYKHCERLMQNMEQGEVVIRPSSKGTDHLTVTWKVAEGVLQHIDVIEEGKENAFSLGSTLKIQNEEFEDLDEIVARFIQPMAAFARDLLNYKYFKDFEGKREAVEKQIQEDKRKAPSRIPYYFTVEPKIPGKFLLSYMPRKTVRHEYVSVTPDGIRYRSQNFHSISSLIKWFKEHFRDPIPGGTPNIRTPVAGSGISATPKMPDQSTIQRAIGGLPNSVFNNLSQIAGTPGLQYAQTPLMTPLLTPSYHTASRTPGGVNSYPTPHNHMTTPAAIATTPGYHQTPRAWPGATPQGGRTPLVGNQTPGRVGGQTPARVGGQTPARTPARTPGGRTPQRTQHASQDWAKMAEMWAKRKQQEAPGSSRKGTPRGTPRESGTPAGDTPLYDER